MPAPSPKKATRSGRTNPPALQALGKFTAIPASPDIAVLEVIPAPQILGSSSMLVRFSCPEFTSLCPVTGQPDFAHFVIDYLPNRVLVESKSLKLFLHSFRNHASFHELVTATIGERLVNALKPNWIRVVGFWYPRGGIPIDVFWEMGDRPAHVPEPGIPVYQAR